jgi:hypothetical protein
MNPTAWLVLVAVAVVVVVVAVVLYLQKQHRQQQHRQKQRSAGLHEQFGSEYERTVQQHGDQRRAESELEARQERVERLAIRALSPSDQEGFAGAWHVTQAHFVDDPTAAIRQADRLVSEVMLARGYPMADFERRAADASVDHPRVVDNYRSAHHIALRNDRGEASTEELRQALVDYRGLFEELLEAGATAQPEAPQQMEVRR